MSLLFPGYAVLSIQKAWGIFFEKGEETLISRVIHQSMDVDSQGFPG